MRFAVDTGGTFTDLIVEDRNGQLNMFKSPTIPADPISGVLEALQVAANGLGLKRRAMLEQGEMFIYGTTHAINAIITGHTARTALLVPKGHRDILTLREGGRLEPFNFTVPYPDPFVPRALTWEVPGRLLADGAELEALDEQAVLQTIEQLRQAEVQAVAVCLLWSIVNPAHELRIGELLEAHLPGVPYTLSHQLNPIPREFRRASSACIDASLKPMMRAYMQTLVQRLRDAGFPGRVVVVTSQGGVMDAEHVAEAPIHLINSGPSMAPISGKYFALADEGADTAIIADTGGTTYDVSLVRRGVVPRSQETWIGAPYRGIMTGFPSVDVKSVGAGGGSIAWVDDGGMLHVGPQSAGAAPGPACYRRGGEQPTVTDASLALGYIDPDFFLGGKMKLDAQASRDAIEQYVAKPLGMSIEDAAAAIITVATENMVQAINDITINQGINPREAVLIGGGGAAGLNSALIARRLDSPSLVIPQVGATMSAAGAMMSELTSHFQRTRFTRTDSFDFEGVNATLASLLAQCKDFIAGPGRGSLQQTITFWAEARYQEQVWELEVPLRGLELSTIQHLDELIEDFHQVHEDVFAIRDTHCAIEIVGWRATVTCRIRAQDGATLANAKAGPIEQPIRRAYFAGHGYTETKVERFEAMQPGNPVQGPAIIESSFTTVVLNPGDTAERRPSGSLSIIPGRD
ncbi:hydantoinase/oxoprolinase family protein [Pseudomonas aeruginosa]|uniref:hydantoinase/oxoprolinase family protein n=1 Tax=Pseudomonas aeruginosa TaxID=287 RepID=UPI000EB223F8|nr:hydantoinase/oxoprolinase family protein [Pseudomonas aeruginosa]MCV3852724.1 hydantoinase/oxoprolinase family protein [Pseudomonas aeruginosa]MCV3858754.1 hydantoinase/oxoprolinase family protein [Pseudomonas aeruginosa]